MLLYFTLCEVLDALLSKDWILCTQPKDRTNLWNRALYEWERHNLRNKSFVEVLKDMAFLISVRPEENKDDVRTGHWRPA